MNPAPTRDAGRRPPAEPLRRLVDALPVAVVRLDGAGRIADHNAAAPALLGTPLAGERWRDVIERAFAAPHAVWAEDDTVALADGRRVEVTTGPLGDGPGQFVMIHDVSGARAAEAGAPHESPAAGEEEAVAVDPRSRYVESLARRVAATDATVMITGESGVGKEVMARYLHRHSRRAEQPFVAINCAAIPDNMLEATLFGHEKGAFTGAYAASPGKFEQAQNGTLLLDEISEMDLGLQAKLLRVLQEREVERLGGRRTIALDVRVLATSNRALREEVAAGRFREDLFYRLNVFPLHLPALRERGEDILPLARRLMARAARHQGRSAPRFDAAAEARLLAHDWPGNVRELDNVVQRALILQAGPVIEAADLHLEPCAAPTGAAGAAPLGDELRGRERELLIEALRAVGGSRKAAAAALGISERTLRYKLARFREAGVELPV